MHDRRIWSIALAAIFTLVIATGYVSAQGKSRTASEPVGDDADNVVTFRVRIQSISADSDQPILFAPGVWVLHSEAGPLFTIGEADRGQGLEALAEDGDPTTLAAALRAQGLQAGIFDTPVCADAPGPLPSSETVEFGDSYEFEVTASPETSYLSFATMFAQSNDLFLAPSGKGIALFDENGTAIGAQDVTADLLLWDAGTEANEEQGVGPYQAPRQLGANTGPADKMAKVRVVDDGFSYPEVTELVRVYIVQVPMVERDRGARQPHSPDQKIGEIFRVGDVQWRVLSAENLGHELKNEAGDRQTTDERFVQVRFEFLNVGSDPLGFEAVEDLPIRDSEGRTYEHYQVSVFSIDRYPREFIEDKEECFGGWFPYPLKPNILTTCTTIFEVKVDATDLLMTTGALDEGEVKENKKVDLNLSPVPVHSSREYVRVGDVRWQLLSAEDLGHVLEANGSREKTKERFLAVRFQLTNKGSEDLEFPGAVLRDSRAREYERGRFEFLAENEKCTGGILGPFVLKPNIITTCVSIYEVPADATDLIFIADDLDGSDDGSEIVALGLSNLLPVPFYLIEEDVEIGDVCWHVLSVEDLGQELKNEDGDKATTQGRFLQTQFQLLNLSSGTLRYDGMTLMDRRGRQYSHFGEFLNFIADDKECPPSRIPPGPYPLKPNTPTTCTTIHEVAKDAKNLTLLASDLEGFEAVLVALPNVVNDPQSTTVLPGKYEVGSEIAPGVYRGEATEDTFCKWARLKDLKDEPESIAAMGLREGPFYLEILDSDAAFTTECKLVPIDHLESHEPLLMSVSPGMYVVGLDIGPGQYKGEPQEDLFCFWQRLNNFREEDDSTIEWDIPGEEYVVEVSPSDFAVEFACPVQKVE